ncbi:MAG: DUF2974 domain-containing protein [Lachnospiraceae bacterium]|nr:DUF2974 domain-containing protein [Lachnospiraceae bacterium]
MNNIIDYVRTYGKFSLDEENFNEVDSLVLSQFSYLKFDDILNENKDHHIYISELKSSNKYETLFSDERFKNLNKELLEEMIISRRFSNMGIFEYVNLVDPNWEIQFSAITCVFDNGFVYVVYRGTDETLTGWKEDFNMSFICPVPAQIKAVQYLNRVTSGTTAPVTIGGHSKGGNLAIYAAMMCEDSVKKRITNIYSHDGPGFTSGIIESAEFKMIKDRIKKTVPRSSIVGMLFDTMDDYDVVICKNFGFLQHDPFNWLVNGKIFKRTDDINRHTKVRNLSVNRWIENMEYDKRQEFVDLLFDILRGSGSDDLNDFKNHPLETGHNIKKRVDLMDKSDRKIFSDLLKDMSRIFKETSKEFMVSQMEEEKGKYKKLIDDFINKLDEYIEKYIKG